MATPEAILAEIDDQILTIISTPDGIASYKIGDKEVDKAEIIQELRKTREFYTKLLTENTPAEDTRLIAELWDDFGRNDSIYIGEPDDRGTSPP